MADERYKIFKSEKLAYTETDEEDLSNAIRSFVQPQAHVDMSFSYPPLPPPLPPALLPSRPSLRGSKVERKGEYSFEKFLKCSNNSLMESLRSRGGVKAYKAPEPISDDDDWSEPLPPPRPSPKDTKVTQKDKNSFEIFPNTETDKDGLNEDIKKFKNTGGTYVGKVREPVDDDSTPKQGKLFTCPPLPLLHQSSIDPKVELKRKNQFENLPKTKTCEDAFSKALRNFLANEQLKAIDETRDSQCEIRSSCGRVAQIGDIYDARTEKFVVDLNIFATDVHDLIITSNLNSDSVSMVFTESVSDKAAAFSIQDELLLSLLTGLLNNGFNAVHNLEELFFSEQIQCSYVKQIRTVKDSVDVFKEKLKRAIIEDFFKFGTHVVVGITYGINATFTITCDNEGNNERARRRIKKLFKKFENKVFGREKESETYQEKTSSLADKDNALTQKEKELLERFKFSANVLPSQPIKSIADVLLWTEGLKKDSDFKGKQMEYFLMPLAFLSTTLNLQNAETQIFKPLKHLSFIILERLKLFLVKLNETFASLKCLKKFVNENEEDVSHDNKQKIKQKFNQFELDYVELRRQCAHLLVGVRSGEMRVEEIENFIAHFGEFPYHILNFVKCYKHLKDKKEFSKEFLANGVTVVTEANEIDHIKIDNYEKEIFFFFFSYKNDHELSQWPIYVKYFENLMKACKNHFLAMVDLDVIPSSTSSITNRNLRVIKCFEGNERTCQVFRNNDL